MTKLIGITGLARAGKDTLAKGFIRAGYERKAFADALKEATAFIANEPTHLFFDDSTKEGYCEALGMTRRRALQSLGKGVRDSLGETTWVNRLLREWEDDGRPATVISDVRYLNEAQEIIKRGGIVIKVTRSGAGLDGEAAQHESERGLPDDLITVFIVNNGSIGDLYVEAAKVDKMVGERR